MLKTFLIFRYIWCKTLLYSTKNSCGAVSLNVHEVFLILKTETVKYKREGMIRIFRNGLTLALLMICSLTTIAQTESIDKPLIEQLNWNDFLVIKVSHNVERYDRKEINIVYNQDSIFKIHSILKESPKDNLIDTVFILNEL